MFSEVETTPAGRSQPLPTSSAYRGAVPRVIMTVSTATEVLDEGMITARQRLHDFEVVTRQKLYCAESESVNHVCSVNVANADQRM